MKAIYNGFFIDVDEFSKLKSTLSTKIKYPHITMHYWGNSKNDKNCYVDLIGYEVDIICYSYGINEDNEGYLCDIITSNEYLQEEISHIKIPHITTSVSINGKPVNTSKLKFNNIEPIYLKAKYGMFLSNGNIIV